MSPLYQLPRFSILSKVTSTIAITALISLFMIGKYASAETPTQESTPASSTPPAMEQKEIGNKFAENKERELARIAKHLHILQTLKTCIHSANDRDAIRSCHKAARISAKPVRP